jgi:hypothetical protein
MHYCCLSVASDGSSRYIAAEPNIVLGLNVRDKTHDVVSEWEQINEMGTALCRLLSDGWAPLRETPMAPEWTQNRTGVLHSLVVLQKEQ